MGLFNFLNKKEPVIQQTVIKKEEFGSDFGTFNIGVDYSKPISEVYRSSRGYLQGNNGLFAQELNNLYKQSPLHSAIINFKRLLTVGNGYSIIGESTNIKEKISLNQLTNQFNLCIDNIGMDLFLHSKIGLLITWNEDNTRILKVKRLSPETIHINEINDEMEPTSFLYNWDWSNPSKYPTKKYPAFNQSNKKDKVQLYFYQLESPEMKLYAEPTYMSSLNWVVLDSEMSQYHKANILNSINPSILIQYFEKPGTMEEKQNVLSDINQSFAGSRKTGRAMVTFADGKELSPEITQMEANKLDKTFLSLTDTIQRQICYGGNINPELLGLKTPGSLGNSGEFEYSFNLFNQSTVQPAQRTIETILNTIISINGLGVKLKLNDVEISVGETKISTTVGDEVEDIEMTDEEEKVIVNENLTNLTAKQHQQLLRIIRQYNKEQLTEDAARILLGSSLGLDDDQIDKILGIIKED